jgi:type II secretory ATPase GspE/PulE/Tfp pilus assembly ATPase PilB-like protein
VLAGPGDFAIGEERKAIMPRSLPPSPSVRFLQKEAKDLLKSHKAGDPACCPTLRYHYRFSRASDKEILAAEVSLQEVQHALALDYGFKGWSALKAAADTPERGVGGLFQSLLRDAASGGAADLHLEPMGGGVRVRQRIDGVLHEMTQLSRDQGLAVTDEVFRVCNLDAKDKQHPQDGRMLLDVEGRAIDVRVNVTPMMGGSSVVMRLLDRELVSLRLEHLKMEPAQEDLYRKQVRAASGLILVSGPAGCGKTTTLYASLMELRDPSRKIVTIEDPVEVIFEGISQMRIRPEIGLGYEDALRTALRQAPNVIMVGEVRSLTTAQLLVQAAVSGHLAFSAMHTNDCPSTIERLINMGLEPFQIVDAVRCVVAQRLLREICPHCKSEYQLGPDEVAALQLGDTDCGRPVYRGAGCEACRQTGYKGRGPVYSIMPMTPSVARRVADRDLESIASAAREDGWTTLREAAIRKLLRGETTVEEVIKFT